jgi:hypothetical protein
MCPSTKEKIYDCDPKFYVTWFGTDAESRPLQSSGLAMSKFRQYSIGSLYNSTKSAFDGVITDIKNTFNDIANKTQEIIKKIQNNYS